MKSSLRYVLLTAALSALPLLCQAATPQSFKATFDGKVFESDDDSILYLSPVKGTINLIAKTKGASSYPPPKTPVDSFSIICRHFEGKPVKWSGKDFGNNGCEVQFEKGVSKKMMGDPDAAFDARDGQNMLEITSVKGKVVTGKFSFELRDKKTKAKLMVTEGSFVAEDRQL
jgi:hypothetical protein